MSAVNIPITELKARKDFNSHICLEYYRGNKWSEYLAFGPAGLQKFRETTSKFESNFKISLEIPLERVALSLLKSINSAYLPGDGVSEILMELYIMSITSGTGDLAKLDTANLIKHYNDLATTAKKPLLISWKQSKAKLLEHIIKLQQELIEPTAPQKAAKKSAVVASQKRLSGLATIKEKKKTPVVKEPKKNATVKELKKKAPITDRRKFGIGAFCRDLIVKNKTNEEVLASVRSKFPDAATSISSIAWYRNKLKNEEKLA